MPTIDLVAGCSGVIFQSVTKCGDLLRLRFSLDFYSGANETFNKIFGRMIDVWDKKIQEQYRFAGPFHVSLYRPIISDPIPVYVKDNLLNNLAYHKERLTLYYELMSEFRDVMDNPQYEYTLNRDQFREVKKLMLEIDKLSHSGMGWKTNYDYGMGKISSWERFANDLNV